MGEERNAEPGASSGHLAGVGSGGGRTGGETQWVFRRSGRGALRVSWVRSLTQGSWLVNVKKEKRISEKSGH